MSPDPISSRRAEALSVVLNAVAIVCEVDEVGLSAASRFADLDADSLSRVSIADVVEASYREPAHRALHIDDAVLGRMATLADLADHVATAVDAQTEV